MFAAHYKLDNLCIIADINGLQIDGRTCDVMNTEPVDAKFAAFGCDVVKADAFAAGDHVDVTGISKGHGYAGVVKRHGAHTLKATHGTGPVARHAGSMGSGTDPSRIFKGKIGAGHMGVDQVTVMNLDVVKVDPELNMIVVRGAIPGPKGGLVTIRSTAKTIVVKKGGAGISANPQKASARVNPQKASARR